MTPENVVEASVRIKSFPPRVKVPLPARVTMEASESRPAMSNSPSTVTTADCSMLPSPSSTIFAPVAIAVSPV